MLEILASIMLTPALRYLLEVKIEMDDNESAPIPPKNTVMATATFIGRWYNHREELINSAKGLTAPEYNVCPTLAVSICTQGPHNAPLSRP
mgnify:CR=1 FL=1